jgi:hypothetical protein
MRVQWIVSKFSVDERATMMAVWWRAGRGVRSVVERVLRGLEKPTRKETGRIRYYNIIVV